MKEESKNEKRKWKYLFYTAIIIFPYIVFFSGHGFSVRVFMYSTMAWALSQSLVVMVFGKFESPQPNGWQVLGAICGILLSIIWLTVDGMTYDRNPASSDNRQNAVSAIKNCQTPLSKCGAHIDTFDGYYKIAISDEAIEALELKEL